MILECNLISFIFLRHMKSENRIWCYFCVPLGGLANVYWFQTSNWAQRKKHKKNKLKKQIQIHWNRTLSVPLVFFDLSATWINLCICICNYWLNLCLIVSPFDNLFIEIDQELFDSLCCRDFLLSTIPLLVWSALFRLTIIIINWTEH